MHLINPSASPASLSSSNLSRFPENVIHRLLNSWQHPKPEFSHQWFLIGFWIESLMNLGQGCHQENLQAHADFIRLMYSLEDTSHGNHRILLNATSLETKHLPTTLYSQLKAWNAQATCFVN